MAARPEAVLAHATELAQRDEAVAAEIDVVESLLRRADATRARALDTREQLAALPERRAAVERATEEAARRELEARAGLAEAEATAAGIAASRRAGGEAKARTQRDVVRAQEALGDARAGVTRVSTRREELDAGAQALGEETILLIAEARSAGEAIATLPRVSAAGKAAVGSTLGEVEEWGARVHAALFVVRGGLENERERIVAEANALAGSVLGEQIAGSSVALVRARLVKALAG